MFDRICKEKLGPLALRLALGLFCVYHGYLKIMVAGGTAWNPAMPVGWQFLLSWGELASGLAILVGYRCRIAAGVVLGLLVGSLVWWQGWKLFRMPVQTLEPTILLLLIGLALLFLGAGELSVDARSGASKPFKKK
ncbi:MAG TPA: DoxX family protein [Gemmataceae bacterium]|nr:DoxX family protein [Gemmataceae bacterium]